MLWRPLLYKVVVASPIDAGLVKDSLSCWKSSNCLKRPLTDMANVPKLSEMVWSADVSEDALPDTSYAPI